MPVRPAEVKGASDAQHRLVRWLVRFVWARLGTIEVVGLENFPKTGPCILICNHQSYLDPVLLQSVLPRPVHAMGKSTQFDTPFLRWLLGQFYVYPVRRYQIDPQAARTTLRRLAAGYAVGIFVEGERSWEGRLQTPRTGVIRLLLKAGVPVIPCRIDGAYDVWPRWDRKIKPGPIRFTIRSPLNFPKCETRSMREPLVEATRNQVVAALQGPLDGPGVKC